MEPGFEARVLGSKLGRQVAAKPFHVTGRRPKEPRSPLNCILDRDDPGLGVMGGLHPLGHQIF